MGVDMGEGCCHSNLAPFDMSPMLGFVMPFEVVRMVRVVPLELLLMAGKYPSFDPIVMCGAD